MAFNESQKLSISGILGITPTLLDAQIASLGATLTAARETAILAQVTLWQAGVGTENVMLEPTESNKGVRTNPGADKADIKRTIALMFEMDTVGYSSGAGMGTIQIGCE